MSAEPEPHKAALPPPGKPWKPKFPTSAAASAKVPPPIPAASDAVPELVPVKGTLIERPAERALTEPPPLPEPPSRGDAKTAEASIVVAEDVGAPAVDHDLTEIVVPKAFDLHLDTQPVRPKLRRRFLYLSAAIVVFGAAALAVVLATSSELPKPAASVPRPSVVAAPVAVPAPVVHIPAAVPAPEPEVASARQADVVGAPPAEVVAAEVAPEPAPTAAPARVVAPAPAHKAIARPVKKATKPKYDPDALFFKGN